MTEADRTTRRRFVQGLAAAGAAGLMAGSRGTLAEDERRPGREPGRWRIGCYTRPWADMAYRDAFDAIAGAGFRHVGLMTTKSESRLVISASTGIEEARRIGKEATERKLEIASVYGGGLPVGDSVEAGIRSLRRLIDACAAARARSLLMGGVASETLYDSYYEAISECCPYAAEKSVTIALKPHGGLNATGPECRRAIEKVGHENFTLWYDPGNILYYSDGKLDPVDDASTVDGLVTGMCVKDFRPPKNVDVTPGTGRVDFPAVLRRLRSGGFRGGALIVETLAPGDPEKRLGEARRAREFLERLCRPT